ncbi:hypothetical protein GWK47_046570 [Chionoecetes opilio]|uniref:Uncharacterized protein n=1 Tax=Chionoecetes opilio TaxID=41210 RepID=A0A8J4Y5F5_CHIOP|nr:hypothetical protein GWK47_046570 [Chionoecetes opilio]
MAVTSPPHPNVTLLHSPLSLQGGFNITASPTPMSNETYQRYLRELDLKKFYSTYDVWTGIRTAMTLALFFVFTVTVILYKSKCKPRRKYELYPSLEDMPGRPLDYCDYWCSSPGSHEPGQKCSQDSLGRCYNQGRGKTGSAPLPTQRSVGSYSSLNNSFRVKSLPGSVMRINCSRNSSFERDDSQATAHSVRSEFLSVPGVRLQSTGSSSDGYDGYGSSQHDLSGEMTPMALLGVPGLGPRGNKPLLQLGGMDWDSDHATAEWVQTIDINVIQPTPNISPCGSVRSVSDSSELARLPLPGRGRVTSQLSLDSPDMDSRSIGSDSVFLEESGGEMFSSRSESMDSGSPSLLTPSPRSARCKIQSFRLGINTTSLPLPPSSPIPFRALPPDASPRPRDQRSRQKQLQRQRVQEDPLGGLEVGPRRNGSPMASLMVPTLGSRLRASCERLAAHSALQADRDHTSSRSSSLLAPSASGSTEEEPMCAVFTVPSLRRCNSATTPDQQQQAEGWKRSDSEQNPVMRRSDSATSRHRQSSESSSGSDDCESVSFHLMVPALSLDQPSADTSRASSPALSPPSSPNSTPPPARRTFATPTSSASQSPRHLYSPYSNSSTPSPTRGRGGRNNNLTVGGRGNGLLGNGLLGNGLLGNGLYPGGVGNGRGRGGGRRVLRRQYSQCVPPSPTLRDMPIPPASLPTYAEEGEWTFPPAPPPSPFKAGQALYFRHDSGPASPSPFPHGATSNQFSRQDSSPTSPRSSGYHLLCQDSVPSSPCMRHQDSSPTSPHEKPPFTREASSPTPPCVSKSSLTREDSSPPSSSFPSEMKDDSRHPSTSSSSSSVMETPC